MLYAPTLLDPSTAILLFISLPVAGIDLFASVIVVPDDILDELL